MVDEEEEKKRRKRRGNQSRLPGQRAGVGQWVRAVYSRGTLTTDPHDQNEEIVYEREKEEGTTPRRHGCFDRQY